MEFHLIYAGGLIKSAADKRTRVWEKHAIRRHLHYQMKRLWETHPALRSYGDKTIEERGRASHKYLDVMAHNYERSDIGFIPLITTSNGLVCTLDILFLRADRPRTVLQGGGDIDTRIKVLIDALRIPADASEMIKGIGDEPDPNPMYCLLQDDKLITTLKVTNDRLLFTMDAGENEACLVIRVETANVDPFGSPWELNL
jgi:hypothetical protein